MADDTPFPDGEHLGFGFEFDLALGALERAVSCFAWPGLASSRLASPRLGCKFELVALYS